ncbi:hypothetical protein [Mycoplasmopsis pullorum]|nr:hypothetical protein [Mycoplasmopsis pullorum]
MRSIASCFVFWAALACSIIDFKLLSGALAAPLAALVRESV